MSEQVKRFEDMKCVGDLPLDVQIGHQVRVMRALIINLIWTLREPVAAFVAAKEITVTPQGPDDFTVKYIGMPESELPSRQETCNMIQTDQPWSNPFLDGDYYEAKKAANSLLGILFGLPKDFVFPT